MRQSGQFQDTVDVKCKCRGEIRRFTLSTAPSYQTLCERLHQEFRAKLSSDLTALIVRYVDEEGDLVTLANETDLQRALSLAPYVKLEIYDQYRCPPPDTLGDAYEQALGGARHLELNAQALEMFRNYLTLTKRRLDMLLDELPQQKNTQPSGHAAGGYRESGISGAGYHNNVPPGEHPEKVRSRYNSHAESQSAFQPTASVDMGDLFDTPVPSRRETGTSATYAQNNEHPPSSIPSQRYGGVPYAPTTSGHHPASGASANAPPLPPLPPPLGVTGNFHPDAAVDYSLGHPQAESIQKKSHSAHQSSQRSSQPRDRVMSDTRYRTSEVDASVYHSYASQNPTVPPSPGVGLQSENRETAESRHSGTKTHRMSATYPSMDPSFAKTDVNSSYPKSSDPQTNSAQKEASSTQGTTHGRRPNEPSTDYLANSQQPTPMDESYPTNRTYSPKRNSAPASAFHQHDTTATTSTAAQDKNARDNGQNQTNHSAHSAEGTKARKETSGSGDTHSKATSAGHSTTKAAYASSSPQPGKSGSKSGAHHVDNNGRYSVGPIPPPPPVSGPISPGVGPYPGPHGLHPPPPPPPGYIGPTPYMVPDNPNMFYPGYNAYGPGFKF
ncbi:hypothetical protein IWQ62_000449 [Dispira parvispora]|uniref:PB1 domain-containing protein n=1 Tax=Dispira parvispora TaxID=1520584 RepID=A0A9W8B059_9FUNG|nr:hypothetical protein IWQ62_000449 [Dispira parvispora]